MVIWLKQIGIKDDIARSLATKMEKDGYKTRHDVYEDITFNDADLLCYKKPRVTTSIKLLILTNLGN